MGAIIATPIIATLALISTKFIDFFFWSKWILSYLSINFTRWQHKPRFDLYDFEAENDPYKVNFMPPPEEYELESPLPESQLQESTDEVLCYGTNSKSELVVVRVALSVNDKAEAWIYLRLKDGRTFCLQDTTGQQHPGREKKEFTCGGLRMYYLSPMRTWRIFFNGVLRETTEGKEEKLVHVKFAFQWHASSDTFDFLSDLHPKSIANILAKTKWKTLKPPLQRFFKTTDIYSQGGTISGTMEIDGTELEEHLYFYGEKTRSRFDLHSVENSEFSHVLGHTPKNGRILHVIQMSLASFSEKFTLGFLIQPNAVIYEAIDPCIYQKISTENGLEVKFIAEGDKYVLNGLDNTELFCIKNKEENVLFHNLNFDLNGVQGKGIVINRKILRQEKQKTQITRNLEKLSSEKFPLIVHFNEKICQSPNCSGGKGSSLGKLMEISKDYQNFIVPAGIVVTTAAYDVFLNKAILDSIKILEETLYKDTDVDALKNNCQKVIDIVVRSPFPQEIRQTLSEKLQRSFPNSKQPVKFAVRSSATGEDTEQMSAAGQMETYLGVSGIDEVIDAVKKCWASQFSHIAVQYKRQNGQIINSPMAVVIQQMVPCDVAGVVFTCDPLTGNPSQMSITANYGLGESVVSGSAEPDAIELIRTSNDGLDIKSKKVGQKGHRVIMNENGGTDIQEISPNEQSTCCLSDNAILRLGSVALNIEKSYGSSRDIEWGYWNNNLYVFQSRPVTSGMGETDFEIDHEFDAPLRTDNEYFSMANVGEVMPGATSPLGADVMLKFFYIPFKRKNGLAWKGPSHTYFPRGIIKMYHRIMFYTLDLFHHIHGENSDALKTGTIGMFGRIIEDEEMFAIARERHKSKVASKMFTKKKLLHIIYQALFGAKRFLKSTQKAYSNYRIPVEKFKNSKELFDALLRSCTELSGSTHVHMQCSESSSFLSMMIFTILKNQKGEVDADVYNDFAELVTTSSGTESADVPAALEKLASYVAKDIKPEEFKKMNVNEATEWLNLSTSESGVKYREFLQKHGHRCLKEFDIMSSPWSEDPKPLVQMLQNLVGNADSDKNKEKKKENSVNNVLSKLSIPLNWKIRLLLKFLLPYSRNAVQLREYSKSLLIRTVNDWRKGYKALAKMMTLEGRIPDANLFFFMTLEEIRELLNTRSPTIIARANHRRRRFPELNKFIFPEIMKGFPEPINKDRQIIVVNEDNFFMKGIPVSKGVVRGYVRVALTLEEAAHLKPGEILLTYSTDIGWSPYFPMLGGVVTELGGLISHGAVVSREYGLPCIAGLHGATQQFQTGDYVLLDGNKGILQKITKPEEIS